MKKQQDSNDSYWVELRKELGIMVEQLEGATSGRMLGPVMLHPNKKNAYVNIEVVTDGDREITEMIAKSRRTILEIEYE